MTVKKVARCKCPYRTNKGCCAACSVSVDDMFNEDPSYLKCGDCFHLEIIEIKGGQ